MKIIIITFIYIISFSISLVAQNELKNEQVKFNLLVTDSIWSKEVFTFPIKFAQEINYKGVEEAQFPKGWSQKDSPNFWSYVFVWDVEGNQVNSEKELEMDLKTYFDGLMNSKNTITQFHKMESSIDLIKYSGIISFFDNLRTKENISLNVLVEKKYCKKTNKSLIIFRFSPKEFNHKVWSTLEMVVLRANICNHKQ
ncbi:MAG: hypothetical protein KAH67_07440 [Flavobacteriaceae bacterium]|nr:hypothetical protein [Flavobacteriaceae bacterium]